METVPSAPPEAWEERERARFLDGTYQELPWAGTAWWHQAAMRPGGAVAFHYAHVSEEDPTQVAYTPSAEYGQRGRKTRMRPGRYLARFFPTMDPDDVRAWAGKLCVDALAFADTADEWERVYTSGPSSCMSAPADEYSSNVHPVRVYAGPDLQLAYLVREGVICARTIAWPARRVHSRIYGDASRLAPLLEAAGYSPGSLVGARLQRVPQGDRFVCPYIDRHSNVRDDGDWLVIDEEGSLHAHTSGLAEEDGVPCAHCEERFLHEDDLTYFDAVEASLCGRCADEALCECYHCNEYVRRSDAQWVERYDRNVCSYCLEQRYTLCEAPSCGEHVFVNDAVDVFNAAGDTLSVCEGCAADDYAPCPGVEGGSCSERVAPLRERCPECEAAAAIAGSGAVSHVLPVTGGYQGAWILLRTATPAEAGIAVTLDPASSRPFALTHEPSGLALGARYRTLPDALRAAAQLRTASGIDWQLPAQVLTCALVAAAVRHAIAAVAPEY